MKRFWILIATAVLSFGAAALAQSGVQLEPGVARVSLVHGDVNMQRGDSGDWVAVTLNTPIVAGDRISTGQSSRAEVQLDFANVLRLDQNSTAKIADLTRTHEQVQMGQGLANYDVMKGSEADAEIDTPNVSIHPLKQGRYRILVNSDSETQVIVRQGAVEVTTPQGSTRVESGDMITVDGTDSPQYQTASAPHKDDWDNFNNDRDHIIGDAESWQHANRYYTGSQDLDAYGRWEEIPEYGSVWVPAGGPDWAPYRDGRWVWEPYYGWTWVSYEPWGWAPYHYGRWFLYSGSWCWWPGPVYGGFRPLWAPAYVSFFGFGHHGGFGVGFGFGSIGWLPIGPGDGFFPWYGHHRGNTVNIVNVTNITNITNVTNVRNVNAPVAPLFRGRGVSNLRLVESNPRLLRGVSTVPTENFGKGAVPANGERLTPAAFRSGGLLTGQVPAVPTRESLRPVDRAANVPANAGRLENQRFFGKSAPVANTRSFSSEQARVQNVVNASASARGSEPTRTAGTDVRGSGSANERLGSERSQTVVDANAGADRNNVSSGNKVDGGRSSQGDTGTRTGWHRFGDSNSAQSSAGGGNGTANRDAGAGSHSNAGTRSTVSPREPASRSNSQQDASPARDSGSGSSSRGAGWHSFSRSDESTPARSSDTGSARSTGSGSVRDSGGTRESASPRSTGRSGSSDSGGKSESPKNETPRSDSPRGSARTEQSSSDSGGWHSFSRSPESVSAGGRGNDAAPAERGSYSPSYEPRASSGNYGRSESSGSYGRSGASGSYGRSESSSGYSRPQLDMRQPIATPRSYGSSASSSHGGYHSSGGPHTGGASGHSSSAPHSSSSSHGHSR